MGDLTEFTEKESEIVTAIMAYHKKRGDSEKPRRYLGASILGTECSRALWYAFRLCIKPDFSGRLYRLFETGQLEEARFVTELRAIGIEVHEVGEDGKQFGISEVAGHFKGHMDGVALGVPEAPKTWHVLEFKTHNDKSFTDLKKKCVKLAKPSHYVQMMVYMGSSRLTRALYLAKNKDTEEIYAERVRYDAQEYARYIEKARRIITSITPPERITDRPDDFRCRFCDAKELCWGQSETKAVPLAHHSCRSCCHATPVVEGEGDGVWRCEFHGREISFDEQLEGCEKHLCLPDLIHFAKTVDAGKDWIEFENKDGARWHHGEGHFTTRQLMAGRGPMDGCAPSDFWTQGLLPLHEAYPMEDSRVLFEGTKQACWDYCAGAFGSCLITRQEQHSGFTAYELDGIYCVCVSDDGKNAMVLKGVE